jgi:hypothetical protein
MAVVEQQQLTHAIAVYLATSAEITGTAIGPDHSDARGFAFCPVASCTLVHADGMCRDC